MELYRKKVGSSPPDGRYTAFWWWADGHRSELVQVEDGVIREWNEEDDEWDMIRWTDSIKVVYFLQLTEEDLV
jgi:hypothetical protein